jgi:molybdate transport system ATP-binding protein
MIEVEAKLARSRFTLDVNFHAGRGITALFGPSGAGKSTVLNLISGLERPDSGSIKINGKTLFDSKAGLNVPVHKRRIGYVFQDELLFPHMSVRSNLIYGYTRGGLTFESVVDLLDIGHLIGARPATLSGGERQRVAIGRALLSSPQLLLMDEPLASLDMARKSQILPYIERLNTAFGIPVIYVSHAVGEVTRLAKHVIVMQDGKIAGEGAPQAVLPLAASSSDRFDRISLLTAIVHNHDAAYGITQLDHKAGQMSLMGHTGKIGEALTVVVRATDVTLAKEHPHGLSARTALKGTIASIEADLSPVAYVNVKLASNEMLIAALTRKAIDDLDFNPGDHLWCLIKAVSIDERWMSSQ